ncbi:MAG: YbjN domain-containing protein, partial [Sphingopyxis sp.]|nr:YbjN domain-containing protein [Sphingopyxis sp.]
MTNPNYSEDDDDADDPVELIARYCDAHGWAYDLIGDEEVVTTIKGSWASYELRAVWRSEDRVLQMLLFPEIKMVDERRSAAFEALSLINEQLWMGHFEHWAASDMILYRHATLLGDDGGLSLAMADTLVQSALDECERFYPVFQFVLWGG